MPILAAPLEALAALGLYQFCGIFSSLNTITGFILAGVPVYFITQRTPSGDTSEVAGRFRGWLGSIFGESRSQRGGWTRLATEADGEEVEMQTAPR